MTTFYLTFGQKYRREPHPQLGARPELPDGWLTVTAETEDDAREQVVAALGTAWGFVYSEDDFGSPWMYTAGHLGTLQQALAHHRG